MTREEYDKIYNKKFVNLAPEDEEMLNAIFKKIEFSQEDKRILNAFYIPNNREEFKSPEKLSPSQMQAELRNIFLLLKYNYCGYDYFNKDGELDRIHEKLKEIVDSYDNAVDTIDYFKIIMDELHTVIKDNHFSISCNDRRFGLSISKAPFFTDLIVEEQNDNYVIINNNDFFVRDYVIKEDITKYLFKTLPNNENECYLIGLFQSTKDPVMCIEIDNINLPLHISKSANVVLKQKNRLDEYENYNMVTLTMCNINDEFPYKKYREWGELLKEKKTSAISVIGNPGGSSVVGSEVIGGLNGNGIWDVSCSSLNIFQKTGLPIKYYTYEAQKSSSSNNTYDKKLYVLMNKNTASAGESLVSISNNVKNVIKIGTNTMGCGFFGEVITYILPQSHATIRVACKTFFMNGFEEGTGFTPDYWMDDSDMIETFKEWMNKQ